LFGLLAVELAVTLNSNNPGLTRTLAVLFFLVSVFFVWKSFYGMRIESKAS
jgi:K(+)-stimulated pyrophosphate-energized sodium pump